MPLIVTEFDAEKEFDPGKVHALHLRAMIVDNNGPMPVVSIRLPDNSAMVFSLQEVRIIEQTAQDVTNMLLDSLIKNAGDIDITKLSVKKGGD